MASNFKKNWLLYTVLPAYSVLVALGVAYHEPWFDEAQVWLLARDTSPLLLIGRYLRYEGSTGLWHLIMIGPAKLGFPYVSLNVIAALIAIAGVYVLLRYSKFPTIVKVLLPFTFWLLYQYAVVARNYVLLAPVLFLIATVYRKRFERPYVFVLLVCLLANVSLHGFVIAIGIVGVHFWDLLKRWRGMDRPAKKREVYSYVIFAIVFIIIVLVLWPAQDSKFFAKNGLDLNPKDQVVKSSQMLNDSFTELSLLTFLVLGVSLFWFRKKRVLLLYLAMTVPALIVFGATWGSPWHQGILFLIWVFVMWLSFDDKEQYYLESEWTGRLLKGLALVSMLLVIVIQLSWSYDSLKFDIQYPYSGSKELAQYIKDNHLEDKTIYATRFKASAILPYFSSNIFADQGKPTYGLWSVDGGRPTNTTKDIKSVIRDQPDYVIVSGTSPNARKLLSPESSNYRLIGFFKGYIYCKNQCTEDNSFSLFQRIGPPLPKSDTGPAEPVSPESY